MRTFSVAITSAAALIVSVPASAATMVATVSGYFEDFDGYFTIEGFPNYYPEEDGYWRSFEFNYYYELDSVETWPYNGVVEDSYITSAAVHSASGQIGHVQIPHHSVTGGASYIWDDPAATSFGAQSDVFPMVNVSFPYLHTSLIHESDWRFNYAYFTIAEAGGAPLYSDISTFDFGLKISRLDPGTGPIGAIPEPATWLMLLAGFGAIGFVARNRRARVRVAYA